MDRLSSQNQWLARIIRFLGLVFFLGTAGLVPTQAAAAQPIRSKQQAYFNSFGFTVSGFTDDQEQFISQTLAAYGRALGGPAKLREIILTYNCGSNWTITYAPEMVGANSTMKLSPTVFNIKKAIAANYSTYAASNDQAYARIMIGHEIDHILFWAIKARTGVDWAKVYQQRVRRDWSKVNSLTAPEEEAVTELSLKIQSMIYYFNLDTGKIETDPEIVKEIDDWAANVLAALKKV